MSNKGSAALPWKGRINRSKPMKKVINGKVYDTDTAKLVARYTDARFGDDFNAVSEKLYHTKKGNFFLYGRGYIEPWGEIGWDGNRYIGSNIIALTEQEARDWIEKRGIDPDEVEEFFPFEEA